MTTVRHWKRASQPAAVMCFTWRRIRLRVGARVRVRVGARDRVRVGARVRVRVRVRPPNRWR